MENASNDFSNYEVLDKDYGRVWAVGPGYGEIDPEQYEQFLKSLTAEATNQ